MSEKRTVADIAVQGATNRAALEICLEPLRSAARCHGYAVAVHGSVARDIDLIAVPWTDNASNPEALILAVCGAIAGALGRCRYETMHKPARMKGKMALNAKPHGRRVCSLHAWVGETSIHFDFGVMPLVQKAKEPA